MKRTILLSIAVFVLTTSPVSAELIRDGIDIDFVTIGNAGNPGDTRTGTDERGWPLANPYGCGAVGYEYQIGKYEITNAQWNAFVSAAGVPTGNLGDRYDKIAYYTDAQQPTNNVSWYEALQFCNYLTSGDKSNGVYRFSGNNTNPGDFLGIDRTAAQTAYGTIYFLPTEDEWYKAAYYEPDGSGYSLYANGTNTSPVAGVDSNYDDAYYGIPWNVGAGTIEQNGTFDMMGNVWEWNESPIYDSDRVIRGGSFYARYHVANLASSYRRIHVSGECYDIGFRVASIPEPASILLLSLGGLMLKGSKLWRI